MPFFRLCTLLLLITAVYALVHAAMQRPDAYTAVDKLTKPVWLIILAAALLLAFVLGPGFGSRDRGRARPASISSMSGRNCWRSRESRAEPCAP